MTKDIWFKRNRISFIPVSWEGWVLSVAYIIALVFRFFQIDSKSHSGSDTLISFGFYFVIISVPLLLICYLKGEKINKGAR